MMRTALLFLSIACLALPVGAQEGDLGRWIDALGDPSPEERARSVEALRRDPAAARRALLLRLDPERGRGALGEDDLARIDRALAGLGAAEYERRAEAENELVRIGRRVLPRVEEALRGAEDPEVRHRLESVRDRILAEASEARESTRFLEILGLIGRLGPDDEAASVLLAVIEDDLGYASATAHLALRALVPAGPGGRAASESLEAMRFADLARTWRTHLDRPVPPPAGDEPRLVLAAPVVPDGKKARARTEILNASETEGGLTTSRDGRLAFESRGSETSVFREEDRGGEPRVVRRTYESQELVFRSAEGLDVPFGAAGAAPLAKRVLDLTLGDPVLVDVPAGSEPLPPGGKFLITLGSLLGPTLPAGEYVRGRPVEMPPAAAFAFLPFIEDSVRFTPRVALGRATWLGTGEDGLDVFACDWHFQADPPPSGSTYRVWLAGRFEVDREARTVVSYEVEGLLLGFQSVESVSIFRTEYRLEERGE